MPLVRPGVLATVLLLALTGCGSAGTATGAGASPGDPAQLTGQQALERNALQGLAARTCPARPASAQLGSLPDVTLACLGTGPSRRVSAGDGRITVVNLWASWCRACVQEMPLLQRTSDRAGTAVAFVGINTEDERASAAGLLAATGVRYPSYEDPKATVRAAVRALGLPVTLVYDASGREVARRLGAVRGSWLDDALRRAGATMPPATG